MTSKQRLALGILTAAALAFCGRSLLSPDDTGGRIGISGTVTYHGEVLDSGRIRFTPDRNTAGPAVSTTIEKGKYRISGADGILPGDYEVTLTVGPLPNMDPASRLGGLRDRERRRVAAGVRKESVRWPVPQVVPAGEREVQLDFELPPTPEQVGNAR
jgi:hypothetical protein